MMCGHKEPKSSQFTEHDRLPTCYTKTRIKTRQQCKTQKIKVLSITKIFFLSTYASCIAEMRFLLRQLEGIDKAMVFDKFVEPMEE